MPAEEARARARASDICVLHPQPGELLDGEQGLVLPCGRETLLSPPVGARGPNGPDWGQRTFQTARAYHQLASASAAVRRSCTVVADD